jgi:predicted Zn finger-like uncharacterized protein
MIIQCEKCEARYRFDDALMEGDGVWVRCSRCGHVFFQAKPQILDTTKENGDTAQGEELSLRQNFIRDDDSDWDEFTTSRPRRGKFSRKTWENVIIGILVVVTLIALSSGIYFFIFPRVGQQVFDGFSRYVPENIFSSSKKEQFSLNQLKLVNIRQRFVNNVFLGYIRVVEGSVVNKSSFPITRVQVASLLYDAYDIVLDKQISYCGNLLNETELGSFTEDEIRKTLSFAQGSDVSNDRVDPNGQIPFMVVFTHDPGDVSKTVVKQIAAERLLQ